MGISNVMNTGRSGMMANKAAIATAGHNVANASTEGYTRQRVDLAASPIVNTHGGKSIIGTGVDIKGVSRINNDYLDKQLRTASRELSHHEEKDVSLSQIEDVFNEMGGEGLNRVLSKFFNDFRNLSNDPSSLAIRESVRESSQALVNDLRRMRKDVVEVQNHVDARLEGYVGEINSLADTVRDLNVKIKVASASGASPNDLLDQRQLALKNLGALVNTTTHTDKDGAVNVDVAGVGPLVTAGIAQKFSASRGPADADGKPENALDLFTTGSAGGNVTHQVKGGKMGAILEVRDQTIGSILDRLDEIAFAVSGAVNDIHRQGYTAEGVQGVNFFSELGTKTGAAERFGLSDAVKNSSNAIASGAEPNAPGDNRIALAISGLQGARILNGGKTTVDDWFNSIVSDVGVATSRNRSALGQQQGIVNQLGNLREQISGVSIDEETANILQYQHSFDASAKVIQVADEMLKTVLDLKR